jgi:hypothetical protein
MIHLLDQFIEAVSGAMLPVQVGEHFADLARQLAFTDSAVIAQVEPAPSLPVVHWRTAGNFEDYARNNPPAENPLAQYALTVDTPFDVPTASAALGYRESDVRRLLYPAVRDMHIVVFRFTRVAVWSCSRVARATNPTTRRTPARCFMPPRT